MAWGTPVQIDHKVTLTNDATIVSNTISLVAGRLYLLFYGCHRTGAAPDLSTGFTWTGLAGTPIFIGQSATFNGGLRVIGAWSYIPAANETSAVRSSARPARRRLDHALGFVLNRPAPWD